MLLPYFPLLYYFGPVILSEVPNTKLYLFHENKQKSPLSDAQPGCRCSCGLARRIPMHPEAACSLRKAIIGKPPVTRGSAAAVLCPALVCSSHSKT